MAARLEVARCSPSLRAPRRSRPSGGDGEQAHAWRGRPRSTRALVLLCRRRPRRAARRTVGKKSLHDAGTPPALREGPDARTTSEPTPTPAAGGSTASSSTPGWASLTGPVLVGESSNPSYLALHPNGRVRPRGQRAWELRRVRGRAPSARSRSTPPPDASPPCSGSNRPAAPTPPHRGRPRRPRTSSSPTTRAAAWRCCRSPGTGGCAPASSFLQPLAGSGPNRERQASPHAHQIVLDPSERFALVARPRHRPAPHLPLRLGRAARWEPGDPSGRGAPPGLRAAPPRLAPLLGLPT